MTREISSIKSALVIVEILLHVVVNVIGKGNGQTASTTLQFHVVLQARWTILHFIVQGQLYSSGSTAELRIG